MSSEDDVFDPPLDPASTPPEDVLAQRTESSVTAGGDSDVRIEDRTGTRWFDAKAAPFELDLTNVNRHVAPKSLGDRLRQTTLVAQRSGSGAHAAWLLSAAVLLAVWASRDRRPRTKDLVASAEYAFSIASAFL